MSNISSFDSFDVYDEQMTHEWNKNSKFTDNANNIIIRMESNLNSN